MKLNKKSIISLLTALMIVISLCSVNINAEAASKKSLTLFVGEKVQVTIFGGTLKSVKSSKKKVCTVKKKSGKAVFTAKKSGKSKVTIKTSRGKITYNVTVKKNPFKVTLTNGVNGVAVSVKNSSAPFVDQVKVDVTFRDAAGNVLSTSPTYVYYMGKGQTASNWASTSKNADLSKTTYKIAGWSRPIESKCKKYTSKVTTTTSRTPGSYSDKFNYSFKTSYSGKGGIYAAQDVFSYNAAGQLTGVNTCFTYLYKNKKSYSSYTYLPKGTNAKVMNTRATLVK